MVRVFRQGTSKRWYVDIKDASGKRKRVSTGCIRKRDAELVGKRLELEARGASKADPIKVSVLEALSILRGEKIRAGRSKATLKIHDAKAAQLIRLLGAETNVEKLRLKHSEKYLDKRISERVSHHTVLKELGTLRHALNHLARHDRYSRNPANLVPTALKGAYTPRDRWLTRDEFQSLLQHLPEHRRMYVAFYVYSGARFSELYKTERHGDQLVIHATKAGGTRRVPIAKPLQSILNQNPLPWALWDASNMNRDVKLACKKAGIQPVTANDLRRTFASWLAQAGVPELTVARLLGHQGSTMVRRVYAQLSDQTLLSAIDKLSY